MTPGSPEHMERAMHDHAMDEALYDAYDTSPFDDGGDSSGFA